MIDLREIFSGVQTIRQVDAAVDMRDYEVCGVHPIREPVQVHGQITNSAGVVTLDLTVQLLYEAPCDRCAQPVSRSYSFLFSHVLVTATESDEYDYIVVENALLDLDALVRVDVILNLPSKFLCKDDCKGICPGCGKLLNEEACVCKKEIDPRLEKLKDFYH